jgi:tRNA A-37 threonylcarbamoyl transferase component Bud32
MISEDLRWGVFPANFKKVSDGNGNRMVVRQDCAGEIDFNKWCGDSEPNPAPRYRGRAALRAIPLSDGETALIRPYQHGGLLRGFTGPWFFTWPPRPFRELSITEELRRRGVRTVEIYAACVSRGVGPFYRGWLVTRELRGSADLWSALQSDFIQRAGLQATLQAVAMSVRAMHREGIYHSDLNLKNILVRMEVDGVAAYIIDFDKAKLVLGKLPTELAKKNLDRLLRSIRKLDPERKYFSASAWEQFRNFYYETAHG